MKEIGGYLELDTYHLPLFHEDAIMLNSGRNALAYVLKARNIKKLWIPWFICDAITGVCNRDGVSYSYYNIGFDFLPSKEIILKEDEWLYFVNYYSQFDNHKISEYVQKYKKVIVDNAHSFFQKPIEGVDTLYTCRKYFGVPDGAFLYTDAVYKDELSVDESFGRMNHILGRFERSAADYYNEYVKNEDSFAREPIKKMSKLTNNLLHGIDYKAVESKRQRNFLYLHDCLKGNNRMHISQCGTFAYPLLVKNGAVIRKKLQTQGIYIPVLWPNLFEIMTPDNFEYQMAENILPLPIDQRYGVEAMDVILQALEV